MHILIYILVKSRDLKRFKGNGSACYFSVLAILIFAVAGFAFNEYSASAEGSDPPEWIEAVYEMHIDIVEVSGEDVLQASVRTVYHIYKMSFGIVGMDADELRDDMGGNASSEEANYILEHIQTKTSNVLNDAFPNERIEAITAELDGDSIDLGLNGGSPIEPIIVNVSSTVVFTPESFGFEDVSDAFSLTEVICGILKLGAEVDKEFELSADRGHINTFKFTFGVASNMKEKDTPLFDEFIRIIDAKDALVDEVSEVATMVIVHVDPLEQPDKESVYIDTLMDIYNFDSEVYLNSTSSLVWINISVGYEDTIPDTVRLNFINGDGIRLIIKNELITQQELQERELGGDMDSILEDLQETFGDDSLEMSFEIDSDSLEIPFDINAMNGPPLLAHTMLTEPTRISPESMAMPESASVNDLVLGMSKLGAVISDSFTLTAGPYRHLNYTMKVIGFPASRGLNINGSISLDNVSSDGEQNPDKTEITWKIDNLNGTEELSGDAIFVINHTSPISFESQNVTVYTDVNIISFTIDSRDPTKPGTDVSNGIFLYVIDLLEYNVEIPETVTGLNYLTSDGLRLAMANGLTTLENITSDLEDTADTVSDSLFDLFGNSVQLIVDWNLPYTQGYDIDDMGTSRPVIMYLNLSSKAEFNPKKFLGDNAPETADVHDLVLGVLKMGAAAENSFDITVEANTIQVFNISFPSQLIVAGNLSSDDLDLSAVNGSKPLGANFISWVISNSLSESAFASIDMLLIHVDPLVLNPETNLDVYTIINVENFKDRVIIETYINLTGINVADYDIEIPSNIKNLSYITSDGIRLAIENGLASWDDIIKDSSSSREEFEETLSSSFGMNISLEITYRPDHINFTSLTNSRLANNFQLYNINNMNSSKPVVLYMYPEGNQHTGFSPSNYGIADDADMDEVVLGVLKLGAYFNESMKLSVDKNSRVSIELRFSNQIRINGSVIDGNVSTYRVSTSGFGWIVDNRGGDDKIEASFGFNLSHVSPLVISEEKLLAEIILDIADFDTINLTANINLYAVDISRYEISISNVEGLNFITADAIRMVARNGIISWDEIMEDVNKVKGDIESSLEKAFGGNIIVEFHFENGSRVWRNINLWDVNTRPLVITTSIIMAPEMFNISEDMNIDGDFITGFLNAGATLTFEVDKLNVENYTLVFYMILPNNMALEVQEGTMMFLDIYLGRNRYFWDMQGDGFKGQILSRATSAQTARGYGNDGTNANVVIDISSINISSFSPVSVSAKIKLEVVAEIRHIGVADYLSGDIREVVVLDYINSDAIRLSLDKQVLPFDTLNQTIIDIVSDLERTLSSSFGNIRVHWRYDHSTLYSPGGRLLYDVNDMRNDIPIRIIIWAEIDMYIIGSPQAYSVYGPDNAFVVLASMGGIDIPVQGIDGWYVGYRVIMPKGIEVVDVGGVSYTTGTQDGREYFMTSVDSREGGGGDVTASLTLGITPLLLLYIGLPGIPLNFGGVLLVFIVLIGLYRAGTRNRRMRKKQAKLMKKNKKKGKAVPAQSGTNIKASNGKPVKDDFLI